VAYGRVSMRKTREILRLKFEARLSHRQIGRACGVSYSTVADAVENFHAAGLAWPGRHAPPTSSWPCTGRASTPTSKRPYGWPPLLGICNTALMEVFRGVLV